MGNVSENWDQTLASAIGFFDTPGPKGMRILASTSKLKTLETTVNCQLSAVSYRIEIFNLTLSETE
ncbi:MAG: hypothetical protein ACRC62_31625 [Microcoleus sp.]